jgi:hypothetical protein
MNRRGNSESAYIAPLNWGYGRISSVDEDEDDNLLERKFDNFRSVERGSSMESSSIISSKAPLLLSSESYSITPEEKTAIIGYLDNSKEIVNLLKLTLIDLFADLLRKNDNQTTELAKNDRTNCDIVKYQFSKPYYYYYDLNNFVHHNIINEEYKKINNIVYKLKFIKIIYLILLKNASQGEAVNEYKEPPLAAKAGGNQPGKYKSTGITVSILYKNKKYKRTVYTKDNKNTKYCKIDGEYILLSKMKNLSNKNPQRTFPKTRGGLVGMNFDKYPYIKLLQLDTLDSKLKTKIEAYLNNSVATVNFLKHRLVYKLLEYMNVAVYENKSQDSSNVFTVYNLFKEQNINGLYVYDLKDFKHYTDYEDKKYKEIDIIVYKLKLINILYLILKNNLSQGDKQKEYKGNKFKYDLSTLLKDRGTENEEQAMNNNDFKAAYAIWVKNNKFPEDITSQMPVVEDSMRESKNIMDKLTAFILLYNTNTDEKYKLLETDKFEELKYKKKLTTFSSPAFNDDTRWDSKVLSTNMKDELIAINSGIISLNKNIKDGDKKIYPKNEQEKLTFNTNIDRDAIHNANHDALNILRKALEIGTAKITKILNNFSSIKNKLREFILIYNYIVSNIDYQLKEQTGVNIEQLLYEISLTRYSIGKRPAFNDDTRWDKWKDVKDKKITNMKNYFGLINDAITALKKNTDGDFNTELTKLTNLIDDAILLIENYDAAKKKIIEENLQIYKDVKESINKFIKSYNDRFKTATITINTDDEITELKYKGEKERSITFINEKIAALHLIYAKHEEVKGKDFQDAVESLKSSIVSAKHSLFLPMSGGNPSAKYKSTGITVSILYEKKKYKRTVYTKDNRKTKYCKINNKYILLSKLNVIE